MFTAFCFERGLQHRNQINCGVGGPNNAEPEVGWGGKLDIDLMRLRQGAFKMYMRSRAIFFMELVEH